MNRIPEPEELMDESEQAFAYASADFSKSHQFIVDTFKIKFKNDICGDVIDLGCGPGDVSIRFAKAYPNCNVLGVDGAKEMLKLAQRDLEKNKELEIRIKFFESFIPSPQIPRKNYQAIISNSLLHHLHDPSVLWNTIKELANHDTFIFIADLFRPENPEQAKQIVEELSPNDPEILKRDFYNSLCAAFTTKEIENQLKLAGLENMRVETIDEIHLIIWGKL